MGNKHEMGGQNKATQLGSQNPTEEAAVVTSSFYAQAVLSLCFSCSIAARKTEETKTSSINIIMILQDTDFYGHS